MSFKAEITARLGWDWDSGAVDNSNLEYAKQLLDGNGDDQADAVWWAEDQTITTGNDDTLDLRALTRTVLGVTLTTVLLKVKALLIVSDQTSAGEIQVGNAAANIWSACYTGTNDRARVPTDSVMLLSCREGGWTVDATHKDLKLYASGGNVKYSIAIVGTITS